MREPSPKLGAESQGAHHHLGQGSDGGGGSGEKRWRSDGRLAAVAPVGCTCKRSWR